MGYLDLQDAPVGSVAATFGDDIALNFGASLDMYLKHNTTGPINEFNVDTTYLRIGSAQTGTTGHSLGAGDVLFEGKIEIDNAAYFDSTADFASDVTFSGGSTLQKALSGDIVFECSPAAAGTSAATLNAAAAGTHTQTVTINLKNAAGDLHKWASLAVNAAASEVVVDTDVSAPTVDDATPDLVNGTVDVVLTYDTDEGATKTYAADDTVTLTITDPTDGILGYSIANATFVDTIVA